MKIYRTSEVAKIIGIHPNTVRMYEEWGLLPTIECKENGYRVYNNEDIERIKVIWVLRCANYSLDLILRMLNKLSQNPNTDIKDILNTPSPESDIISVCDNLIISLEEAEENGNRILDILQNMKATFKKTKNKPSIISPTF